MDGKSVRRGLVVGVWCVTRGSLGEVGGDVAVAWKYVSGMESEGVCCTFFGDSEYMV